MLRKKNTERLKEKNPEMYQKQDRDRKRIQREALKKTTKYEAYKAKDRMRKRKQKKSVTATSTSAVSSPSHSSPLAISSSFSSKQVLGKATARATRAVPKSPQKKAQILSHLVSHLSPNTKAKVFCSARKKISLELGHPVISAEFKERVIHFLERPDIPGRADTVYCGKNNRGDKIYKSKHYLFWTIQDMVEIFNTENPLEKVSYYVVQQIIKNEKHLCKIRESKDDDCRCEKCENVELLLSGIKQSLKKMVIINWHLH